MILNKTIAAVTAVTLAAAPVAAKIDDGTVDLINTVSASDITVTIDDRFCIDNPGYSGVYMHSGFKRELHLCPRDHIDADDHDTVRHEVWHAIQHCANVMRGTPLNTPVSTKNDLTEDALAILGPDYVRFIQANYNQNEWLLEYEANIAANIFTAEEIEEMFKKLCLS